MKICALCRLKIRWSHELTSEGLPVHRNCLRPRICAGCGARMPSQGTPRMRDGELKCRVCDPREISAMARPAHVYGSRTFEARHLTREFLASQAALLSEEDYEQPGERPKTWGECAERTGPCPWVSCKHHLYLDVNETGSIKLNFPKLAPEDLEHPCVLRLAAGGPVTLDEAGKRLNVTRERMRQMETRALVQLRRRGERLL